MTPNPKTPAPRLARVFRILAALAERGPLSHEAEEAAWYARVAGSFSYHTDALRQSEEHATAACRAAGIDPETIQ